MTFAHIMRLGAMPTDHDAALSCVWQACDERFDEHSHARIASMTCSLEAERAGREPATRPTSIEPAVAAA